MAFVRTSLFPSHDLGGILVAMARNYDEAVQKVYESARDWLKRDDAPTGNNDVLTNAIHNGDLTVYETPIAVGLYGSS